MTSIKKLRLQSGMSQLQLAEEMGVAQPTVSAWENGVKFPSGEKLIKLAVLFGVKVDALLYMDSSRNDLPEDFLASRSDGAFEGLTHEEIDKLAEYALFIKSQRGNR